MVVLAFVVLLTGVVVAYFSRVTTHRQLSNSSLNQAKVDELARSALDIITSELKQEIAAGSTPGTVGNTTIYMPTSGAFMMPLRNPGTATSGTHGTATGTYTLQTLLRLSSTNALTVVSATVGCAASNASSTGTSANGRSITPARWNSHYLNPRVDPSSTAIDSTPNGACSLVRTPPSWIFVTNQGPTVLTSPTSGVIGRYAYAMYDEGALLDINAAGYPTALPASTPHPAPNPNNLPTMGYASKGALAFADLTQIPCAATTYLTGNDVNNLIGWRNYVTAQASGALGAFTISTAGAAAYYDAVVTNTTGFLKVATSSSNGRTDQAFLSRQQLLGLRRALGFSQNALPYLGTFSRAVTAPSWKPATPPSSSIDYAGLADNTNSANRNIPNVRFPHAATVAHYKDDGTMTTCSVAAGDPLLQRRFSLAKLAWLTHTGPLAGVPGSAIQACFGLQWNAPKSRWEYTAGTVGPVAIKTLDQVAAENREPNFFELLKAGILNGSLGRDPGAVSDWNADPFLPTPTAQCYREGPVGKGFEAFSSETNRHILQIGANIIDQADADDFPTAIHLQMWPETTGQPITEIADNTVYGVENLPYLHRLYMVSYEDWRTSDFNDPNNQNWKFWMQPELWNPHQAPAVAPPGRPTHFRVRAYGAVKGAWYVGNSYNVSKTNLWNESTTIDYDATSPSYRDVYFADTGGTNSLFYSKPRSLRSGDADNTVATTDAKNLYSLTATPPPPQMADTTPWDYAAIYVGQAKYTKDVTNTTDWPSTGYTISCSLVPDPMYSLSVDYWDGSAWLPYGFMSHITTTSRASTMLAITPYGNKVFDGRLKPNNRSPWHADPRTDRFSATFRDIGYADAENTLEPNHAPPYYFDDNFPRRTAGFHYPGSNLATPAITEGVMKASWAWMLNLAFDPAFDPLPRSYSQTDQMNSYYSDPDGVVRPADGFRGTASTGDGCYLFHSTNLTSTNVTRRPVILNRPFRSVGELGYAYRDLPWKNLDFCSSSSGDGALLDLFSAKDEPPVMAGQINPSTASVPVLQAILSGAMKNDSTNLLLTSANAQVVASQLAAAISGTGASPIYNRADLPAAVSKAIDAILAGNNQIDMGNKAIAEAPVRALSSVSNSRTWNLMIDVIAQTGGFPATAPQNAAALNSSFYVQGERRYWLHIAIDRFTGQIVDQQLEPVYE